MTVIGLTGGIATGKSTVSHYLMTLGIPVCDTDIIARQVVMPSSKGLQSLVDYFGRCILTDQGSLNRQMLARIIFDDEKKRDVVNAIIHPLVFEAVAQWKKEQNSIIMVIDMPLLFETGYDKQVDMTMVVYATKEQQIERLQMRNQYTLNEALSRIDAQMSMDEKIKRADIVIDNTKDIAFMQKQVRKVITAL